ncbi:hypothetical protein Q8F55_005497 [Vanrija albida]|uniref:Uncharacterized protein n=1 Tax=Vanrija albida TaxID=181172 RepID=A0ABR3Q1T1_9TREE
MPAPTSTPSLPPPAGPGPALLRIPDPLLKWPELYTQGTLAAGLETHGGIPTPLAPQAITELFTLVSSVFSSTFATGPQLEAGRALLNDVMARIASKQSFREGVSSSVSSGARRSEAAAIASAGASV